MSTNFHLRSSAAVVSLLLAFAAAGRAQDSAGKYIGPGSCAATSCHGAVRPVAGSRILQNEYSTWILQDKHSRAYQALTGEVGERMARILKLGAKAEDSPKCLACHALYAAPEQRGRAFEISEGVSCENCHGPAQGWLGQHTARDSEEKHAESVRLRMVDTRNVITRSEKCLECHLGTKSKFVDHEMIAAGHPDLTSSWIPSPRSCRAIGASRVWEPQASPPRMPLGQACANGAPGKLSSFAPHWSGWYGARRVNARTGRISGPNIPSFPASLATTPLAPPDPAGARNTAMLAAALAILPGTPRATPFSAFSQRKSIRTAPPSWTETFPLFPPR